ncbi:MAG: vanadium-dependent haloperoxidase [Verrucomicrobiales bacterium]
MSQSSLLNKSGRRRSSIQCLLFIGFALSGSSLLAEASIARTWNEQILAAIRIDRPNPPVHARNLFSLATVMYDAWAAYDTVAVGYLHHERATAAEVEIARREAISYAAYRLLKSRYANSVNAATTMATLDSHLASLGYNGAVTTTQGPTPAAVGNRIAADVMAWGLLDASNQQGGYADPTYSNSQPVMIVLMQGTARGGIPAGTDPNRWQPLALDGAVDQNGIPNPSQVQNYVGLNGLKAQPFSLTRTDPAKPWIDLGGPSKLGTATDAGYKAAAMDVLTKSALLNDPTLMDISPGSGGLGNNPLGTDDGSGYAINPVSGQPYASNPVPRGDFVRVLAEFWADGPESETPPGHWHVLANEVSDDSRTVKIIGGVGPVVSDLEWDVKLYFALAGATHNAACAAWSLKRYYEGPRPITMIRYMGSKGQSSDPQGPSYHPEGLPLMPGVVEVITSESSAPGQRHQGLSAYVGQIAIFSWPGEPSNRATQVSPLRWMRAIDWLPYQRKTFNTPAFPGFTSGHSTFSRAGAEILTAYTGSPFFPGGLGEFTAAANQFLVFEDGPSQNVVLQWATYYDAADQAGQSRRWGGIHPSEDDYPGRIIGSQCGLSSWALAQRFWDGSILNEGIVPELAFTADDRAKLTCNTVRGMYYALEASEDLDTWSNVTLPTVATDTQMSFTTPSSEHDRRFFRMLRTLSVPASP